MRRGLFALLLPLLVARQSVAAPTPLDRVVAVVDKSVITLSEIRARARPHVRQLAEKSGAKPDKAAIESIHAEMLQQLINERLIATEVETHHLSVTKEEVDQGLATIAKSNKITEDALLAEVERVGMTRGEYREEIRRQLLDGKWTMLVVRAGVSVPRTDENAYLKAIDEARTKELARIRAAHYIEVRK